MAFAIRTLPPLGMPSPNKSRRRLAMPSIHSIQPRAFPARASSLGQSVIALTNLEVGILSAEVGGLIALFAAT